MHDLICGHALLLQFIQQFLCHLPGRRDFYPWVHDPVQLPPVQESSLHSARNCWWILLFYGFNRVSEYYLPPLCWHSYTACLGHIKCHYHYLRLLWIILAGFICTLLPGHSPHSDTNPWVWLWVLDTSIAMADIFHTLDAYYMARTICPLSHWVAC